MNKELPKGWSLTTINEINFRKSKNITPLDSPNKVFELYSVPHFEFDKPEILKGEEIKSSKQIVTEGEVLLCKINPRLNRVWCVGNYSKHYKIASSEWIVINTNQLIVSKYLKYLFSAPFFRTLIQSEVSGVGGSLTRARPKLVGNYSFPLSPLAEQKRIVAKLDVLFGHLDNLNARLDRIPELLKNFRQQVLTQAMNGTLTKVWRKGKNIKSWENKSIEEISEYLPGYAFKSKDFTENGYQLIRMGNLYNNKLDLSRNPVFLPHDYNKKIIDKYKIKNGDILLSLTGTKYKRDYGYAIKVDTNINLLLNQRIVALRPKIHSDFFLYLLRGNIFRDQFFSHETGGVNQGNVGIRSLKSIKVPVPSSEEQDEIAKRISRLFKLASLIEIHYNSIKGKIDTLPQAILNKALNGDLVPQNPSDEPASVLLERIKTEREETMRGKKK